MTVKVKPRTLISFAKYKEMPKLTGFGVDYLQLGMYINQLLTHSVTLDLCYF